MIDHLRLLFSELKRRGVIKAGTAYCVVAFVALQVMDLVLSALLLPDWVFALLAMLAVLGLPVAVVISWAFEWTPGSGFRWDPKGHADGRLRLLARLSLVALVLVASSGAGAIAWRLGFAPRIATESSTPARHDLDPGRVAVLYLDDLSPTGELGHVAAGFTEALIHELAQVDQLEVLSRHAVSPFRGTDASLDDLLRTLQAGTLIHGSLERRGPSLRATIQLIDATSGANVLSRIIERSGEELLVLRDEIVEETAELLRRRLGQRIELAERRAQTSNVDAWALVQQAEELGSSWRAMEAVGDTAGARRTLEAADSLLMRAHQLDPAWPEPLVLQAQNASSLAELPAFGREGFDVASLANGLETVERALRIDPSDPAALEVRGVLRARLWRTAGADTKDTLFARAEEDLAAAIRIDGRRPWALTEAAELARRAGRFEQALSLAEKAYRADAFTISAQSVLRMLCHVNIEVRDLERAGRWCGEGGRRFPTAALFPESELMLLASTGGLEPDVERAWALVRKLDGLSASHRRQELHAGYALYVAAVLARAGLPDSARHVITRARAEVQNDGALPMLDYYEAHAFLRLGDIPTALDRVERLLSALPAYREYLPADWWFEDVHSHPRFVALTRGQ